MADRIVVLNPNSSSSVTDGISAALEPLRMSGGPEIECATLAEGPPGIESDADVAHVVEPVCAFVRARTHDTAAIVIACFSDPGLAPARAAAPVPVLGMARCGLLAARALGERIGVLSILEGSIERHRRQYRDLGIDASIAADRALGLGVLELADEGRTNARLREVGARLRDADGADVLVLGCAGMAGYRGALERDLGVPVIDPVHAAVAMAIGAIRAAT